MRRRVRRCFVVLLPLRQLALKRTFAPRSTRRMPPIRYSYLPMTFFVLTLEHSDGPHPAGVLAPLSVPGTEPPQGARYTTVVDGCNVAYFGQNKEGGKFQISQVAIRVGENQQHSRS